MNKLTHIILLCTFLSYNVCTAQYSEGGQPISFNKSLSIAFSIKFENMPSFDLAALKTEDLVNDQNKGPFRFGYNHFVNFNLTNTGTWETLPNGDRLWRMGIKSSGATSINLAFDDYYMPKGAKLFVYSADQKYVIGAFTATNNQEDKAFATDLIPSESIIIEYFEPKEVINQGRLNLFRVTHGYRGINEYYNSRAFGESGICQTNVNCPLGSSWQNEKRAVVCLVTGGSEFCTGALINNVLQNGKPYVLTANHCGSSGFNTWIFRFKWEAPNCTNPASSPTSNSLSGAVQRASSAGSDFSLVEITGGLSAGKIPTNYNPYFAGWSNVNTPATSAMTIHHPSGDIKKISEAATSTISSTYTGTPNAHWRATWTGTGCTEPGSSGAPLFDQNHRIIGQLHGGPSSCGASGSSMNDYFGKIAVSWLGGGTTSSQLKAWLDPNNTGATTLNGLDPSTIGIEEERIKNNIVVYPNPNSGSFNIDLKSVTPENIKFRIINILGQEVKNFMLENSSSTNYSFDLSNQPNGLYFIEINFDGITTVQKVNIVK